MRIHVVVAALLLLLCIGSADAGIVILSEAYEISGGVASEVVTLPNPIVEDSYSRTAPFTISDRVDGLWGNYAKSTAGRIDGDIFAGAESAEYSATSASGAARAIASITFTSTDPILGLDMNGSITWIREDGVAGHHGFSSTSVRVTDLTSGTTLLDFAPTIPEETPTSSSAPWAAVHSLGVDTAHTFGLTITSNGYGYEPHPLGVASTTVSLVVVPEPASTCGIVALFGCAALVIAGRGR